MERVAAVCAAIHVVARSWSSARGEAGEHAADGLHNRVAENETRQRDAAGQRKRQDLHQRAGFAFQLVVLDLLLFMRFQRQIARPENVEIRAAALARSAMRLHVLALRTFEEQRRVAIRAELHAFRVRRAAFRAGHS